MGNVASGTMNAEHQGGLFDVRHSTFHVDWRYNRAVAEDALIFTQQQFETMLAHVEADHTEERCGLLAGRDNRVERVLPVPNALHSPVAYQMTGREFAEAMVACDFEPLGIFHSHPAGPTIPSPTDVAQAAYPDSIYVVIALNQSPPSVRAFTIVEGSVAEVAVMTEDD